jgi:hypothetical protein
VPAFESFNTSDERFECSVVRLFDLITVVRQPRESDRFVPYIQRILFKLTWIRWRNREPVVLFAQLLLYVPPGWTLKDSAFCLQNVFLCVLCDSYNEQSFFLSVFTSCCSWWLQTVLCAVRTESLCLVPTVSSFRRVSLLLYVWQYCCIGGWLCHTLLSDCVCCVDCVTLCRQIVFFCVTLLSDCRSPVRLCLLCCLCHTLLSDCRSPVRLCF